jgi:hypothetical protein
MPITLVLLVVLIALFVGIKIGRGTAPTPSKAQIIFNIGPVSRKDA